MSYTNVLFAVALILSYTPNVPASEHGTGRTSRTQVLTLNRISTKDVVVVGELFVNGKFECNTSENLATLVAPGHYPVILYHSPKFGYWVPLVRVPGRSGIEIHSGTHSKGCIVVSKPAFSRLMHQLKMPCVLNIA